MNWKASVSVSALIAVTVILIVTLALVNFNVYLARNSLWDYEKNRAKWFLEGRVQEYFDSVISGGTRAVAGRQDLSEKIEGKDQGYSLNVARLPDGRYSLDARMVWKDRYPVSQHVEFDPVEPFGNALAFNGDVVWNAKGKNIVMGPVSIRSNFVFSPGASGSFHYYYFPERAYYLDYGMKAVVPGISYFSDDLTAKSVLFGEVRELKSVGRLFSGSLRLQTALLGRSLPNFADYWNACLPYRDPAWYLDRAVYFKTEQIVNARSPYKERLDSGNGRDTSFRLFGRETLRVYVKTDRDGTSGPSMDAVNYAYAVGPAASSAFYQDGDRIVLAASSKPVRVELPDDAFSVLGRIALAGQGWSFASKDERIESLYFHEVSPYRGLKPGVDYEYDRDKRLINITTEAFFRNEVMGLGKGDGRRSAFSPGSATTGVYGRYFVYVDGIRQPFAYREGKFVLSVPPRAGSEVVCFRVPDIYIKKSPPERNAGVYIDRNDRAAVIDLDQMHNVPANGVILARVPLLIEGNSSYPLVILSTENIYLGGVNRDGGKPMAPVMVASGKGVFAYQRDADVDPVQNRCLIYTPLNSLPLVRNRSDQDGPLRIFGSVVFGCENVQDRDLGEWGPREFVFDPSIREYFSREPFLHLPKSIQLEKIVRN